MLHRATQDGERTKMSLIRRADITPGGCRPPRFQLTEMIKNQPERASQYLGIFVTASQGREKCRAQAAMFGRKQPAAVRLPRCA
jgi:hypothetical protein